MLLFLTMLLLHAANLNAQDECEAEVVVQDPIALYPLDAAHGTKEIRDRLEAGVASNVYLAPGPDGNIDSSYEFLGTSTNYIEFPNGAGLDAKNSMTMLCWLFPGGQDGPLFNYRNTGSWGVHLWVAAGKLFVRFTKRDYSFTNALLHTELKPEDGWKFVGASYDSSSGDARLWVDGNEVQKLNIGTNLLLATQDSVRMGVKIGDGRFFKGRIAQMQVYNVALSQEQIQAIRSKTQVAECQKPLGMERGFITNAQIIASSQWDANHAAVQARLHLKAGGGKQGAWSALANNQNQWLKVDLGYESDIKIIGTQGRNVYNQWVTSYKFDYSNDDSSYQYYRDPGSNIVKVFTANKDRDTVVYHKLTIPMKVRYIRVIPWTWHSHISMRMELYGCLGCHSPLGMESRAISDVQISASSQWDANHAAIQGRLNFQAGGGKQGGWSAKTNNQNQWLQADLGKVRKVTHLATQGRNGNSQWVKSYKVEFSNDGSTFQFYKEQGADKIFSANNDRDTIVYNFLSSPITARFVRIHPWTYQSHISMRMEIYGC